MADVYESRVHLQFRSKRITQRYHWSVANPLGEHPWSVSRDMNEKLVTGSFWFNFLTLIISEKATFKRITTRQILPSESAAAHYVFPGGGVVGQWPLDCGDNAHNFRLQWISANNHYGRFATRLGPLGTGAIQNGEWFPFFINTVNNFAAQHGILYSTGTGVLFIGATLDLTGVAEPVTGMQYSWPPATQYNRIWKP